MAWKLALSEDCGINRVCTVTGHAAMFIVVFLENYPPCLYESVHSGFLFRTLWLHTSVVFILIVKDTNL